MKPGPLCPGSAISRKSKAGNIHGPSERIDRVTALKSATTWGSYYVLRENKLGSLEPGKFADLLVIDRDYLTIPEEQIPQIGILMSMLGGQIKHLTNDLADEFKMKPAGLQVESGHVP
jgi:predicted amidohydrolase YtcJ